MLLKKQRLLILSVLAFFISALIVQVNLVSAATVPDNLLINPSFETQGDNIWKADGWNSFHSGYKRVGSRKDGNWGIRLINNNFTDMSGAYQRIDLNQVEIKPVFIGGYVRGLGIVNDPDGHFGASLYAEIHLQDESVVYWNSVPSYGTFFWRWVGFNTGTLTLDGINKLVNQPISHIFIVPILGKAKGTAVFDGLTAREYTPTQSAVTLMFDDGGETTSTIAKPALDSYGFKGSASIILDKIGDTGFMKFLDIKGLEDNGWEILSHSVSHTDLTTLNSIETNRELYRSQRWLKFFGFNINNFALPYGAYNGQILGQADKYYKSTRAYELGDNAQGAFPNDIKVRSIINTTTPEQVRGWVEEAQVNNRWVVLVFHDILDIGDDEYYVTPENFQSIIDSVADTGVNVVTYDQGIDMFGATK